MLGAMLLWFMCLSSVFTSDKFIYLFGKIIPALSLLLSMTLRFVPKFRRQLETTAQAQRAPPAEPHGERKSADERNALTNGIYYAHSEKQDKCKISEIHYRVKLRKSVVFYHAHDIQSQPMSFPRSRQV